MYTRIFVYCVVLSLLFVLHECAQQCSYDGECGNIYTRCQIDGQCQESIQGLAIDKNNGEIYFSNSFCLQHGYAGEETNGTLKSVPIEGGIPSTLSRLPVGRRPPFNIRKIHTVVGEYLLVSTYSVTAVLSFWPLYAIHLPSLLSSSPSPSSMPGFSVSTYAEITGMDVNKETGETFACRHTVGSRTPNYYTIARYDEFVTENKNSTTSQGETLYWLGNSGGIFSSPGRNHGWTCTGVISKANSDILYFYSPGTVYKGSKSCRGCELPPVPHFTLPLEISEMILVGERFYFSANAIYSCDTNGQDLVQIWYGRAYGLKEHNGKLYWSAVGGVYSANLDGTQVKLLTQDRKYCTCVVGFTGPNCQSCSGQEQWNNGQVSCVPLSANGWPERCQADYQCGTNIPFTLCDPTYKRCRCREGFTGEPQCTQCYNSSHTIHWANGVPYCAL